MSITLICCVDINDGIADRDDNLLFSFEKDRKFFRQKTTGKTCVFGRKTFDTLPVKPLPKRKSYVLTNNKDFEHEGVKVIHSIDEVLKLSKGREVMVCGGAEIYKQLLPHADKMILTHVHTVELRARVFFPDFDWRDWKITESIQHEADEKFEHSFSFTTYEKK